ncbi:nucleotidyltransferase family protein [Microbacterium sp. 18062]|uniref:nucleotidyltransferase family protein n=1 Tax=Microbacterium sp. 18062 TaxID=2681410 RepID=UPI00135B3049|nr:nucleotidyltransferase family protein [Microbacterium sp. 18062]
MSVELMRQDAIELLHAWVQRVADDAGVRVIFIKGLSLEHHGLRQGRIPADVDAWVDPAEFTRFCALLEARGWRSRTHSIVSARRRAHSATYIHGEWPCDIDLHFRFPGFVEDDAKVFEELWGRTESMPAAHHSCIVPDLLSSMAIVALHALRNRASAESRRADLDAVRAQMLTPEQKTAFALLAQRTGCDQTLAAVLEELEVPRSPADVRGDLARLELDEWHRETQARSLLLHRWRLTFAMAPVSRWPRLARAALWPSREQLAAMNPETTDSMSARAGARISRWGRGVRALLGLLRRR